MFGLLWRDKECTTLKEKLNLYKTDLVHYCKKEGGFVHGIFQPFCYVHECITKHDLPE